MALFGVEVLLLCELLLPLLLPAFDEDDDEDDDVDDVVVVICRVLTMLMRWALCHCWAFVGWNENNIMIRLCNYTMNNGFAKFPNSNPMIISRLFEHAFLSSYLKYIYWSHIFVWV